MSTFYGGVGSFRLRDVTLEYAKEHIAKHFDPYEEFIEIVDGEEVRFDLHDYVAMSEPDDIERKWWALVKALADFKKPIEYHEDNDNEETIRNHFVAGERAVAVAKAKKMLQAEISVYTKRLRQIERMSNGKGFVKIYVGRFL